MDRQQNETRVFFNENAAEWASKSQSQTKSNIITLRNEYVLHVARNRGETRASLDVGCGTGNLVVDLAKMGVDAVGIDFAEEMVRAAREEARRQNATTARFVYGSIFDFKVEAASLDLVSANGFIEYISHESLRAFLKQTAEMLRPGGSLVIGTRNRLFNLVTFNAYTAAELACGDYPDLVAEATAFCGGASLEAIRALKAARFQAKEAQHAATGIDVATRYQHTPAQLMQLAAEHGLQAEGLRPVHIHGIPPQFKKQHPEVHEKISEILVRYADDLCLMPFASSFMLHVVKR